ncbi:Diaminobutyrate-2-oxoglutarate transaminase [gamma proteobacterium HdN1]|nr:Diaminobutyrate-2-oxoglutarate transaminase [gamma proteobacterium HdN1]
MSLTVFEQLESEVRGYIRSYPTVFHRAENCWIMDEHGNRYLDFFAGAGALNYGHNPAPLKRAVIDYLEENGITHGLDMATSAKRAFLETFEQVILAPRKLQYKLQFTGPTGTNAVEAAFKLARQVTGRTNIVAFTNAFHGVSLGSLAATANTKFRNAAATPLANVSFIPYDGYLPDHGDSMAYFRKLLEDRSSGLDLPAAVIVETVQGEGGINIASDQWLVTLAALCKAHKILLIVDDIQVGCGRTGRFFSFEEAGIVPDIITLSKSLSGYGLPMSLVLIQPEIDLWSPSAHNGTFRGNNPAFVSATAALNHFWRTPEFSEALAKKSAQLAAHLSAMRQTCPTIIAVRSKGLVGAIEYDSATTADRISQFCFERGLIIETCGPYGEVLKLLPPLTITEKELNFGFEIIEAATRNYACL